MDETIPREHPELGPFRAKHRANYTRFILTAIGWGVPIFGFIGFLLWDIYGPHKNPIDPFTKVFLLGGAALVWLFFAGMALWETGPNVEVYERGFLFGREPFFWDDIAAFYQQKFALGYMGVRVNRSHDYTVVRTDGKKAKFYLGIERADELAELIQERIYARLLDAARREVAAGKSVDFGCAQVDKNGMRYKPSDGAKGELRWTEFEEMTFGNGEVKFRKKGAWFGFGLAVRKVANLTVMVPLIEELVAATPGRPPRERGAK